MGYAERNPEADVEGLRYLPQDRDSHGDGDRQRGQL